MKYRMTPRFLAWEMRQIMSLCTEMRKSGDRAGLRRRNNQFGFGYVQLGVPMTHLGRNPVHSWKYGYHVWKRPGWRQWVWNPYILSIWNCPERDTEWEKDRSDSWGTTTCKIQRRWGLMGLGGKPEYWAITKGKRGMLGVVNGQPFLLSVLFVSLDA